PGGTLDPLVKIDERAPPVPRQPPPHRALPAPARAEQDEGHGRARRHGMMLATAFQPVPGTWRNRFATIGAPPRRQSRYRPIWSGSELYIALAFRPASSVTSSHRPTEAVDAVTRAGSRLASKRQRSSGEEDSCTVCSDARS